MMFSANLWEIQSDQQSPGLRVEQIPAGEFLHKMGVDASMQVRDLCASIANELYERTS